jgi:hypothetical protein
MKQGAEQGASTTVVNENVISHNQVGGITAHTVNVDRRVARTMSDEMKLGLLRELPKDKPVAVMGMNGSTESMRYANEIHAFLRSNGYQMTAATATWHMFFDPPIYTVKISPGENGSQWWIVVGPAE